MAYVLAVKPAWTLGAHPPNPSCSPVETHRRIAHRSRIPSGAHTFKVTCRIQNGESDSSPMSRCVRPTWRKSSPKPSRVEFALEVFFFEAESRKEASLLLSTLVPNSSLPREISGRGLGGTRETKRTGPGHFPSMRHCRGWSAMLSEIRVHPPTLVESPTQLGRFKEKAGCNR